MKSNVTKELQGIEVYERKLFLTKLDTISFSLPKENSLRTLIKYKKVKKTPLKYPRKYSEIKKKSL